MRAFIIQFEISSFFLDFKCVKLSCNFDLYLSSLTNLLPVSHPQRLPDYWLAAVLLSSPLSRTPQTLTSMRGYLNNEAATRDYFTEDGFACMGDLGYYDQEGKLYFKDRIKEVIKVSVHCPL